MLIAQDRIHVEHYVRQPDSAWLLSETNQIEPKIHLASIECDLALREIYDNVDFTAGD